MKKYTQADFDNFEVDEYGRKISGGVRFGRTDVERR